MLPRDSVKALSAFIRAAARATGADVAIERSLPGEAARRHYLLTAEMADGPFAGRHSLVLRGQAEREGPRALASDQEFAVRQVAFQAGLTTPEPLWLDSAGAAIGQPFMILRHAAGVSDAAALQDALSVEEGDRLVFSLGQELARLHRIRLDAAPAGLSFLEQPGADWAARRADAWRQTLDGFAPPQPTFEWAINWFLDHAPRVEAFALCHRDLRLGNFVADREKLIAVLDLEQVGWSDPMEDLGWLCARSARLGLPEREAGGIGSREALYDGYKDVAGRPVDDRRVRFWEIAAAIRHGIGALQRASRSAGDAAHGLRAMLTGLQSIEAEYDLLLEVERFTAEAA